MIYVFVGFVNENVLNCIDIVIVDYLMFILLMVIKCFVDKDGIYGKF